MSDSKTACGGCLVGLPRGTGLHTCPSPRALAEVTEDYRKKNDARALRLGVPIPKAPVSVASLPSTLRQMNDARFGAERQTGAIARGPVTVFGAEQELTRQSILATCDSTIDRAYRGFLADDDERVTFARTVKDFLNGMPRANAAMRAAVERMNNQQRNPSK